MTEEHRSIGIAQWTFIKKIRAAVKNDPKAFFSHHNWRHVTPGGGKNDSTFSPATRRRPWTPFMCDLWHCGSPTC
jgi:hypothetical protein